MPKNQVSTHRVEGQCGSDADRVTGLIATQVFDFKALFLAPIFFGSSEPAPKQGDRLQTDITPPSPKSHSMPGPRTGPDASHHRGPNVERKSRRQ